MELGKNINFFNGFYKKYMDIFESKLCESSKRIGTKLDFPSVRNYLYEELLGISRMVLVFELHCHREKGLLKGNSPEERFKSYNEMVATEEFHQYIAKNYPVLEYLFQQKMEHSIKCVESICSAFVNDKEELCKSFGRDFKEIYDIKMGNGDTHQSGETIAILSGDFGRIVYKSRDLYNDLALNDVVMFLNSSGKLQFELKINRVLCKNGYGWQEFIEAKECKNENEVARFYYREGCYLAIFYIFNSGDMHYENIITDGEYPRIIDTETLVTLSKFQNITFKEPIHNFPMDNVLSASLLPLNNKGSVMDVDLSGLSGGNLESQKIKEYYIENPGTDQMKLVRKYICQKMEQTNIPRINGEQVNVLRWRSQLITGFNDSMNIFYRNKEKLLECITQSDIKYSHQRQLFRNTYAYAKFLETSHYPSYLSSFEQRKSLFEKMRNTKNLNDKRIEHEISLLNEGYIPAYYSMFEERTLYSNGKIVQENYFSQTGSDTVKYKIASLSPETIALQKHIINLSYMTLIKEIIHRPSVGKEDVRLYDSPMDGAKSIFDSIGKNILRNPDNGKQDLYIVRLGDKCQSLQGLDMSLYEGGGLIWSMYCYAKETHNNYLSEQCLSVLKSAEEKQEKNNVLDSSSVYAGIGSVVYILFNLYLETGEIEYYALCEKYLKRISEKLNTIEEIDYMHGISGYVVLLSKMIGKKNNDFLMTIFKKTCEMFLNHVEAYKTDTAGLAHGGSGVALALSFLVKHTNKQKYLNCIKKILDDEKKHIDLNNIYWCRGIAGIVFAKAQILENIQGMSSNPIYLEISEEFAQGVEYLLEYDFSETDNLCMCHGVYGYYDVLNDLLCKYNKLLDSDKIQAITKKLDAVKEKLVVVTEKGLWLTSDYMLETFMLGSSGPAYAMLRMHNNKYPSILSLDII